MNESTLTRNYIKTNNDGYALLMLNKLLQNVRLILVSLAGKKKKNLQTKKMEREMDRNTSRPQGRVVLHWKKAGVRGGRG